MKSGGSLLTLKGITGKTKTYEREREGREEKIIQEKYYLAPSFLHRKTVGVHWDIPTTNQSFQ